MAEGGSRRWTRNRGSEWRETEHPMRAERRRGREGKEDGEQSARGVERFTGDEEKVRQRKGIAKGGSIAEGRGSRREHCGGREQAVNGGEMMRYP